MQAVCAAIGTATPVSTLPQFLQKLRRERLVEYDKSIFPGGLGLGIEEGQIPSVGHGVTTTRCDRGALRNETRVVTRDPAIVFRWGFSVDREAPTTRVCS